VQVQIIPPALLYPVVQQVYYSEIDFDECSTNSAAIFSKVGCEEEMRDIFDILELYFALACSYCTPSVRLYQYCCPCLTLIQADTRVLLVKHNNTTFRLSD
jgi:hypothetical protein